MSEAAPDRHRPVNPHQPSPSTTFTFRGKTHQRLSIASQTSHSPAQPLTAKSNQRSRVNDYESSGTNRRHRSPQKLGRLLPVSGASRHRVPLPCGPQQRSPLAQLVPSLRNLSKPPPIRAHQLSPSEADEAPSLCNFEQPHLQLHPERGAPLPPTIGRWCQGKIVRERFKTDMFCWSVQKSAPSGELSSIPAISIPPPDALKKVQREKDSVTF